MKRNNITTLSLRFWGKVETPPLNNREIFRQSVLDTVSSVLTFQEVSIEYICYWPDQTGSHLINTDHMIYEDCVIVSLNIPSLRLNQQDNSDSLLSDLVRIFEQRTHKHLQVDSKVVDAESKQGTIEMTSDWKYYLKHA